MKYVFYCRDSKRIDTNSVHDRLPNNCTFDILRPKIYRIVPNGITTLTNRTLMMGMCLFYWVMRYCRLFSDFDYSIYTVQRGRKIVHYSVVLSRFFRFPFMAENDIQIGPCWTDNEYRRKGIHSFIIRKILDTYQNRGNFKFWYITREDNIASRESIQKTGFIQYGKGKRIRRFGLSVFGKFIIQNENGS